MNILKLVLMGVVAVVLTVALPFVVGIFVPGTAFITGGKNDVPNMPPGYSYSREELDKFEREMKERVSRPNKSAVDVSSREVSTYVRKSFWWCSWIPWVLLPFLVRIKARSIGLLTGLLIVISVFDWILPIEAILSITALLTGVLLRFRFGAATNSKSKG